MTPWTLPTMPPRCTDAQAASGNVAGCLLSGRGDASARGWGTPPFPRPVDGQVQPWVDVAEGASGPIVREVQQALVAAGQAIAVDGQFGPRTASAVRAFQTARGLAATGVVDAATASALGVQRTAGTWPPPGWIWRGWTYNGSPALRDWETKMSSNRRAIGSVKVGHLVLMAAALPLFEGFVREIQAGGYRIESIGGYNFRCTSNAGKTCEGLTPASLSNHAYGLAIDMNPARNPELTYRGVGGSSACATPQTTDLPRWVVQTAERWGLYWGGYGWSGGGCSGPGQQKPSVIRDPMHFEFRGTPEQARAILRVQSGHAPSGRPQTGGQPTAPPLQPAVRLGVIRG